MLEGFGIGQGTVSKMGSGQRLGCDNWRQKLPEKFFKCWQREQWETIPVGVLGKESKHHLKQSRMK